MQQLSFFCLSVFIGFISGLPYDVFSFFRWFCKGKKRVNKIITVSLDLLFFCLFSVLCLYMAYRMHFPGVRGYILAGFLLGFIIYLNFLHRMLAFFRKVCYNILVKLIKRRKKQEKTL